MSQNQELEGRRLHEGWKNEGRNWRGCVSVGNKSRTLACGPRRGDSSVPSDGGISRALLELRKRGAGVILTLVPHW